jgi:hypothetical protein
MPAHAVAHKRPLEPSALPARSSDLLPGAPISPREAPMLGWLRRPNLLREQTEPPELSGVS